jgi:antirestriction protein ArdC
MTRDLHQEATDRILRELEKGAVPWVKPWASLGGNAGAPVNAATERPYSGSNVIFLWIAQDKNPTWGNRFLTFKQALDLGGNVKKGEHGTKVYFWKPYLAKDRSKDAEADDKVKALVMREYTVFNTAQCENLPERVTSGRALRVRNPNTRDELADEYIKATGAKVIEGVGEAFYAPSKDILCLPKFEAFKDADNFYNVAFHELTHWTGAKHRLDRDLKTKADHKAYAAEELVAELGAAFQSAEFGFDGDVRNAGYIQTWIAALKDDKKIFFTCARAAQKAVDFLRDKALEETVEVREAA